MELPVDLRRGYYLVALIDTNCDHCQQSVPAFNRLVDKQGSLPPLVAICPNNTGEVEGFYQYHKPKFPVGRISQSDFNRLLERGETPRIFLLHSGIIIKLWDGNVPTEEELKNSIEKERQVIHREIKEGLGEIVICLLSKQHL